MLFDKLLKIIRANMLPKEREAPPASSYREYSSTYQNSHQQKTASSAPAFDAKEKAYYEALEITPPANFEQIKASYKKLVRKYHPDLFHNDAQKRQYAEIVTQKMNEAYAYFEKKAAK